MNPSTRISVNFANDRLIRQFFWSSIVWSIRLFKYFSFFMVKLLSGYLQTTLWFFNKRLLAVQKIFFLLDSISVQLFHSIETFKTKSLILRVSVTWDGTTMDPVMEYGKKYKNILLLVSIYNSSFIQLLIKYCRRKWWS